MDPRSLTEDDTSTLMEAVRSGDIKAVQHIAERDLDRDAHSSIDRNGDTLLHIATRSRNLVMLTLLLDAFDFSAGETPDTDQPPHGDPGHRAHATCTINTRNNVGRTALHMACTRSAPDREEGSPEIVETLLRHRARQDIQDSVGRTPLHIACQNGQNVAIVTTLLRYTSHETITESGGINTRARHGMTPLHRAVQHVEPWMAQALILHGAYVHCKDVDGNTPMHIAARNGSEQCVRLLSKSWAAMHAISRNYAGHTPLDLAPTNPTHEHHPYNETRNHIERLQHTIAAKTNRFIELNKCPVSALWSVEECLLRDPVMYKAISVEMFQFVNQKRPAWGRATGIPTDGRVNVTGTGKGTL
jgi:ankyrin repeat protein